MIGFYRLLLARLNGRPQKAMACPTILGSLIPDKPLARELPLDFFPEFGLAIDLDGDLEPVDVGGRRG